MLQLSDSKKIIFKVLFLLICLLTVLFLTKYISSTSFKSDLNAIFSSGENTMKWCPEHVVDFKWNNKALTQVVYEKWQQANYQEVSEKICSIEMTTMTGVASKDLVFTTLVTSYSADGKMADLLWNADKKIFRVQDISFYSNSLISILGL